MGQRNPRLIAARPFAERSIDDYRDLVENLNEGVYRSTPEGRLLLANCALARMLGYESVDELLTKDIARDIYLDPADREHNVQAVIRDGKLVHYGLKLRRKNGEVILAEESSRTVHGPDGRILYFEGIIEDVTDRTAAGREAKYFRDLFEAATENVSDGVIHLALDGTIQYVNSVIEKNSKVNREEILGKHFSDVWPEPPSLSHGQHRTWIDAFHTAIETRSAVTLNNFPIRYRNAERHSDTAFVLKLVPQVVDGQMRGATVFVEYFTEQLRLQRQVLQSEARYRSLVENATDAIWTVDASGSFIFVNRSFELLCGRTLAELKGLRFWEAGVIAEEHVDLVRFHFENKLEGAPAASYEVEIVPVDGERIPMEITSKLLYVEGRLSGVLGIGRDIRQRKALQKELLATKNHLQSIFDNALDAIIATDDQGVIVAWNKSAESIFGLPRTDMVGQAMSRLFPPEQYFQMYRARRSLLGGEAVSDLELTWTRGERQVYLNISVSPIRDEKGTVRGMSAIARDITERKKLEVTLQRLVITDHLTETYNRYYFDQTLEKELTRSRRYGSALSLLLIDIDGFKEINDRYGHLMGDRILKESASLLKSCIRNSDTLVRYGGDEFLVLLPETERTKIRYVVDRIEEKLQQWNSCQTDIKKPLCFSIGSATCTRGADFEKALRRADRLMYQCKNRSRVRRRPA